MSYFLNLFKKKKERKKKASEQGNEFCIIQEEVFAKFIVFKATRNCVI